MSNVGKLLLGLAALSLVIAFVGRSNPIVDGLGKAFCGVLLILFFIHRFFGERTAS